MARPAPLDFTAPPVPRNPNASSTKNTGDDSAPSSPTAATRPNTGTGSGSRGASPPVTPRSLSFLTPPPLPSPPLPHAASNGAAVNPFSPPASVRSFSATSFGPNTPGAGADTPAAHHTPHGSISGGMNRAGEGYPFPNLSPGSTRASSLVDVPRAFSTYSMAAAPRGSMSRPSTGTSLHPAHAASNNTPFASGNPSVVDTTNGGTTTPGGGKPGKRDTFASPPSRPMTIYSAPSTARLRRERPKSTAILVPGEVEVDEKGKKQLPATRRPTLRTTLHKPWVGRENQDPKARWAYWITYAAICVGIAAGAVRAYTGWKGVLLLEGPLCPVMLEDFTNTDTATLFGSGVAGEGGTFFREVDASGFGNGEFEMTTASDANSFVYNNQLYLVPTLTSTVIPESSILDGAIYNLTGCTYNITHSTGYSTTGFGSAGINSTEGEGSGGDGAAGIAPDTDLDLSAYLAACSAVSNATEGKIIPPVMSARISTRKSASLKFGRVEVRAKLPTGDWLWPAIWMLPVDNVYGAWPLSGEIDIMEARGNGPSYPKQGINYVRSSLNWGPATFLNAVAKTYGWLMQRRGRYDDGFHTYTLEWDERFIRTYVDSRLAVVYGTPIRQSFWERGDFPNVVQNGTQSVVLENPWVNGTKAAPFDQSFYLIMNIAVGGTNGWFPDGPEKPWLDGSGSAALDFLRAQDQWYPTWPSNTYGRAMVIDSVKMWEKC